MQLIDHPGVTAHRSPRPAAPAHRSRVANVLLTAVLAAGAAAFAGAAPARAAPAAPVIRDVVTGGDSIAVLWNPAAGTSPRSYTVYRDAVAVATVSPPPAPDIYNTRITTTARYIDTAVVRGRTYQYQVRMTATDSTVSGLSAARAATHPLVADTTGVPDVIASPTDPKYQSTLDEGAALIRTWYPKFADRLARSQTTGADYPLWSAITLTNAPNTHNYAFTDKNTITFDNQSLDDALANADPAFHAAYLAAYLHEMTHVIQTYADGMGVSWLAEGVAVWATHQIFNDAEIDAQALTPLQYYAMGYEQGARFLQWLVAGSGVPWTSATLTRANLVHDANVAANAGTFGSAFFVTRTGRTPAALWSTMSGIAGAVDLTLVAATSGGLCLDDSWLSSDNNNPLQLGNCWSTDAQFLSSVPISSGSTVVRMVIMKKCMDVKGGYDPADGTPVVIWDCVDGADWQYWRLASDGTLRHNRSGKCVQPVGEQVANGVALEVRTCDGAPAQHAQTWLQRLY